MAKPGNVSQDSKGTHWLKEARPQVRGWLPMGELPLGLQGGAGALGGSTLGPASLPCPPQHQCPTWLGVGPGTECWGRGKRG